MKFAIITHVPHDKHGKQFLAYAPYVREMNIWTKFVDEVEIVAPFERLEAGPIHLEYDHSNIRFSVIRKMDLLSISGILKTLLYIPGNCVEIFKAMRRADHIHLRCPGNIGLLGCIIQIFFPSKSKTAKYAGNWDPNAPQPWSYKLQRWILSNTLLTKNMQVLVYGDWPESSKNIKSFFTASYRETDKIPVTYRSLNAPITFVFVGTLSPGKRPLYAIRLVENLHRKGFNVQLSLYGEGKEKPALESYIIQQSLQEFVHLKGNQSQETVKKAFQNSNFVVLPSQSEGWPKVIAEGMFWGSVPIATKISCLGYMLDNGNRGLFLEMELNKDVEKIAQLLKNPDAYQLKVSESVAWSRKYTLDLFENEIKGLLNP